MKRKKIGWRVVIIIVVFLLFTTAICFAGGPSFDCRKAKTWIEKLICEYEELSRLDKEMSYTYRGLLSKLKGDDKIQVKQSQIKWIKARDESCGSIPVDEGVAGCMNEFYENRIEELEEWNQYAGSQKKTEFAPWQTKCWQRIQGLERKHNVKSGNDSICRAFEDVLNTTCEPPEKLKCNWTLPAGEKRFKKLEWKPLNWKEYWELIGDINKSGVREDLREGLWKKEESRILKLFEEGKRSLSITTVDLDHDGKAECVVRYDLLPCNKTPGTMFGVMNPETKRLDWRFEHLLKGANALTEGAEIMLFDGKAFIFSWDYGWEVVMIWDERLNICQFKYLKGGKKK